jgi:hypothetical protein
MPPYYMLDHLCFETYLLAGTIDDRTYRMPGAAL